MKPQNTPTTLVYIWRYAAGGVLHIYAYCIHTHIMSDSLTITHHRVYKCHITYICRRNDENIYMYMNRIFWHSLGSNKLSPKTMLCNRSMYHTENGCISNNTIMDRYTRVVKLIKFIALKVIIRFSFRIYLYVLHVYA